MIGDVMTLEPDTRKRAARRTLAGQTHRINFVCPPSLGAAFIKARKKLGFASDSEAVRYAIRNLIKEAGVTQVNSPS